MYAKYNKTMYNRVIYYYFIIIIIITILLYYVILYYIILYYIYIYYRGTGYVLYVLSYLWHEAMQERNEPSGSAVSVAAVACGILLAGRLSLESLMWMGASAFQKRAQMNKEMREKCIKVHEHAGKMMKNRR